MDFDFNEKMQAVINLAKERGTALDKLKSSGMYSPDYISQMMNQYRQGVQTARDKVIDDFTEDANNQMSQLQDKYIKDSQSVDPIVALLKLTRDQAVIKAMTTDELKSEGYLYKNSGFLNDPEKNNMDYLNTLMAELNSRGEGQLVSDMKQTMVNTWHTNELWKQDQKYNDIQRQLESINVMNLYEPDSLWLEDASASNNYHNTQYFIHDLIE